jgi:hypothetical protein
MVYDTSLKMEGACPSETLVSTYDITIQTLIYANLRTYKIILLSNFYVLILHGF